MTLIANWNISNPVTYARMRALLAESGGGLQEGVVGANDLKVVQRGAGANQSVDVGTGSAWVAIDTGTRNGLGHVYNDATANVTVTASNATNPRLDQIILRWNDSSIPTGAGNTPTLEVLTGTATAGATLDNRTGAAALPNDCLRLADVLVPATSTSVTTANIRDRRLWARGFAGRVGPVTLGTISSTSPGFIPSLGMRVESGGNQIRCRVFGTWTTPGTIAGAYTVSVDIWSVASGSAVGALQQQAVATNQIGFNFMIDYQAEFALGAGSFLFSPTFYVNAVSVAPTVSFSVEEVVKQFAHNGTT